MAAKEWCENHKNKYFQGAYYTPRHKEMIYAILEEYASEQLLLNGVVGQSEQFICPVCGSDKTYKTEAYHCNRCAVTTEV